MDQTQTYKYYLNIITVTLGMLYVPIYYMVGMCVFKDA